MSIYYCDTGQRIEVSNETNVLILSEYWKRCKFVKWLYQANQKIISLWKKDYRIHESGLLPGVEAVLDGLSREVENFSCQLPQRSRIIVGGCNKWEETAALHFINEEENQSSRSRSFKDACDFRGSAVTIYREYNTLVKMRTWNFIEPYPEIKLNWSIMMAKGKNQH